MPQVFRCGLKLKSRQAQFGSLESLATSPRMSQVWPSRCDAEPEEDTLKVVRDASSSAQNKNADANSDTNLHLRCQQKLVKRMSQIVL